MFTLQDTAIRFNNTCLQRRSMLVISPGVLLIKQTETPQSSMAEYKLKAKGQRSLR